MSTKLTLLSVLAILIIVIAGWYISSLMINRQSEEINNQQNQNNINIEANEEISKDLESIPSDASLDAEINSLDQDLEEF